MEPIAVTMIVIGLGVALALLWAYRIAHRLDRLHVRTDLARQALTATLDRRAVVARAIAAALRARDEADLVRLGAELAGDADNSEAAAFYEREGVENEMSLVIARVSAATKGIVPHPTELIAEIADAQARVIIARRFYNDAVRDTRALATRRLVRWLHLGGRAPLPQYFEIIERVSA